MSELQTVKELLKSLGYTIYEYSERDIQVQEIGIIEKVLELSEDKAVVEFDDGTVCEFKR